MRLIDPTNDNDRRKASAHYRRMVKQTQRQIKWRNFFHRPHFAFFDMIVVAFLAAVLSAAFEYLLLTR